MSIGCSQVNKNTDEDPEKYDPKVAGYLEKIDLGLDEIVSSDAKAEIISKGYQWSEGPLWIAKHQMLLFSDVLGNTVYKWTEKDSTEVYLKPSGYTEERERGGEMGSNGLLLDQGGNLVLCQHGNRQMARMKSSLFAPKSDFETIVKTYQDQKFNSPNDAVFNTDGDLFFTDPPYGLENQMNDTLKEIPFQGVYKFSTEGKISLITDKLTRPNGIGLFPDEKTLLVANSDSNLPNWYKMEILSDSSYSEPEIFFSLQGYDKTKLKGLPDGLKVDSKGNVYATGPGGLYFLNSDGDVLGIYHLDMPVSNCALSEDEKTIFLTNNNQILRLRLRS